YAECATVAFKSHNQRRYWPTLQLGLEAANYPSITFCNTNPYKKSRIETVPALKALLTVYESSVDGSLT
ncbi:hypothetical protein GCK32_022498, partial [Trichostrongylus colubriformis]